MTIFSPISASDGATPYTYSYTGTLPTGLSFNTSTGAVTGTPTATYATSSLVFSVKDANNVVASTTSTVIFTVGAAGPIRATATTTAQNLTVGTAMTKFSPLTPSGGATPYTYSYTGTLPTGLSFSTSTGTVSGTPTAAYATTSLVFAVKDANNVVASTTSTVSFTVIAVAAAPVSSYNLSGMTANGVTLGGNLIAPVTITAAQSIDGKAHTYYYWDVSGDGTSTGADTVTHDLLDQIFNGGTLGDSTKDTTDTPITNTVTLSNGVTIHLPTNAELTALFTAKPPSIMTAECGPLGWGSIYHDFWSATLDQPTTAMGYGSYHYDFFMCTNMSISNADSFYPKSAAFEVLLGATATSTTQNLTVGKAMDGFFPLIYSGGAWPYTYSYTGTLPAGLSFNTSTGVVTGTPTATYATANLVFSVKDANNVVVSTISTVSFTVGAGAFTAVTGGCLLDNVTGLMWEQKTTDGGLRDWTKRYSNYSAAYNPSLLYGTSTDAAGFVAAVNATNLCGYSNWRLPTVSELQSIVVTGVGSPTIDTFWFPNTQNFEYWSATPSILSNDSAWVVDFSSGIAFIHNARGFVGYRTSLSYVRLVR